MKEVRNYLNDLNSMFRYLCALNPILFLEIIGIVTIDALLPYINVVSVQLIVDELLLSKQSEKIKYIVVVTIIANIIFRMILGLLKKSRETEQITTELLFQNNINEHEMRLSILEIESNKVQELKRNIEQSKMRNGGVENIIYDFENIARNVSTLIITFIAFMYVYDGREKNVKNTFWVSQIPMIILVIMIISVSIIMLLKQKKQNMIIAELNNQVNQANGSAFAYMQFISNYHFGKEIRMFDLGDYLCNFFDNLWTSSVGYQLMQKLGKEKAKIPCITTMCNEILNIFIYVLALGKAYAKELTVGNIVVYLTGVQSFIKAVVKLIGMSGDIISHAVLLQPFLELMKIEEEKLLVNNAIEIPEKIEEISFEHVFFKYVNSSTWVLEDVSFTINANQRMALVGENGCGKSTLIKLLCRLYDPDKGVIKMNGVDIKKYNKENYWKELSVVFQDFILPALSLGNVISGQNAFEEKVVIEILEKLGINKSHLQFDREIYSDFSKNGVEISGGEGQKIAIARAIYKKAPIIVLDEPIASLDPISESEIYKDFRNMSEDRICIFISHRLQSCRICDFILVLCNGRVVEQGTHNELMTCDGKYKELWGSQSSFYSVHDI